MDKLEAANFYNAGFGWICRRCEKQLSEQINDSRQLNSRLMHEGEAENKKPQFSTRALAKWADESQRILTCPHCGVTDFAGES